MTTITQTISDPGTAPDPATMSRAVFSSTAATWVLGCKTLAAQLTTWTGQVNTVAGEVSTNATNAATSATTATTQAASATSSATTASNAATTALNAPGTSATSTTSLTVGTGNKSPTLAQTGKSFSVGQFVSIADSATPSANWMLGAITAFNAGTGAMTVNVTSSVGTLTGTSWVIAASAPLPAKDSLNGYVGLTNYNHNFVNQAGTFTSYMTNLNTASRTYTFQDRNGTMADLSGAQTFTGGQSGAVVALTDASTIALDLSLANQYKLVIGGNRTLGVPTNITPGQQGIINIWQDATGTRTLAYAWCYSWSGGTAKSLSTPGCTRDMLAYSVDYYATGTFTVTIATPGVFTLAAHGMISGQKAQLSTTGALPTGVVAATTYFVHVIDANTFHLCTTLANVAAGTYIATSGSQSGTHTIVCCGITLALATVLA